MATSVNPKVEGHAAWPSLPLAQWNDTRDTLQRWLQVIGKTRLALSPPVNHWWHVALYPTARGLTTSPMPYDGRLLEVELDFIDHGLLVNTSDGVTRAMPLVPRSVADFYSEYTSLLESLGMRVRIRPVPSEMEDELPFTEDGQHRSYDPDAASRCWTILSQASRVLQQFRGRFIGKCSPVHLFWGAMDLAVTRFSGRPAPQHPGGIPNLPDRVTREAYSHEVSSCGFWSGTSPIDYPAFYSYAYAPPAGFGEGRVRPDAAFFSKDFGEFILPYDRVRESSEPDAMLLEFLQLEKEKRDE